ncbi:hypothetical protein PRU_1398 [Xylanibacter ruminicola 23]|uniref:DUF4842 domain-containing protein n=1 Tax=Xylanibacter ruminicola (strain ATCC 19189 / DSM 19721 / CIP 105475 / JCM 8958 / 23) TaxID=264731 RepID=D5ESV5_XYLR2|nr:hypothetical protein PRU_1398 [Xylanibacter ruminicola 23]
MEPEPTPSPEPTPTNNKATQEEIDANVAKVFGTTFSPNQDWSSTTKHTVTIAADAPLSDVAKVQILTEAPYFNDDARVLNEATTSKGQSVSLTYDCPAEYTELVAACVDSKGVYYVTGFKAGDAQVNFQNAAQTRTRAAYDLPDMPDAGNLKMKYKNSYLTYNAIRTIKANADAEGTLGDKENSIEAWKNTNWEKERIWMLDNAGGNSTWKVEKSAIYRTVTITDAEKKSLETVLDAVGGKKARDSKYKQMNLTTIRTSPVYVLTKNYLVADGKGPITVTPVQMLSTEIDNTSLYYYYFDPKKLEGKSEEEQVIFLKNLPKFKCVDSKLTKTASGLGKGNGEYFKAHEYLLPYFGDVSSDETGDVTAQGFIFPEGTRIGFMLRKTTTDWSDSFSADNDINKGTGYTKKSYNKAVNGEVYADGRLNKQINHYPDFMNALDKGMLDDDPRVAIFGANQRTYLMFEEGADVNYADIIVEVNGGLYAVDAAHEINNNVYTFCFEDRNLGDYDMNDVVIKAERLNISQVKYTVAACGANDELYLRNIDGKTLNTTTEIHKLFGVDNLSTFINTQTKNYESVSEVVTVDPSFSFTDFSKQVYIYNKTQNYDVKMSQKGEEPHGIMIPCDFKYPTELTCIKDAYTTFNSWGENPVTSTDWYLNPVSGKVFDK